MHTFFTRIATILCLSLASQASAEGWTQFRGPMANGLTEGTPPPLKWGADENIAWEKPIPGLGHSCPVAVGDNVFLTTTVPAEAGSKVLRFEVMCLDAETGDVRWSKTARETEPPFPTHRSNSYATETPVIEGNHLYVCFGRIGLFCYSLDGELQWETELEKTPMLKGWGSASSPVLHKDSLYLLCDNEADSFLIANDTATGKEKWRVARDEPTSYGTPTVWRNSVRTEIVAGGLKTRSYHPADGSLLWELDIRGGRTSTTPSPNGDQIYIGTEKRNKGDAYDGGGFLFAVKAGASGDISLPPGKTSNEWVAWVAASTGIAMASPVAVDGIVYVFSRDNSMLHAYAEEDGSPILTKQRLPNARKFWASPWSYDGHVFAIDDQGTTFVIRPDATFKLMGTNRLDAIVWASPAIHNGSLFLRSRDRLFCIRR